MNFGLPLVLPAGSAPRSILPLFSTKTYRIPFLDNDTPYTCVRNSFKFLNDNSSTLPFALSWWCADWLNLTDWPTDWLIGTARKPSFTVNFTKRWTPGKSCINRTFSDIEKRSVNSAFSLCERLENMRRIHCFHALEKRRWTPCFPVHFLSFSRAD